MLCLCFYVDSVVSAGHGVLLFIILNQCLLLTMTQHVHNRTQSLL